MPRLFSIAAAAAAFTLHASLAFAGGGVDPTRISLPKGPGSIEGLGRTFAPSLASGTASYGVDIAVPPSAGGLSPHLSLDYDSSGGVTDVGMGWRLSGVPSIRRRTENGLPKFDATDAFEITGLGIPCDLLEITPGTFRPEFESGAFVRVQRAGDGWEARDKSGTTYRFGGAGFTEAEGPNVATWLLREQLDVHGHKIAYAWDTSGGHARLTSVTWNDFSPEVRNVVALSYEDRPDTHVLFNAGIKQSLTKRLTAIEVTHGGSLVRRYELGYAPGVHSRVAYVDLVGRDGTSRMPRLSFAYTEPSFAGDGQVTTMKAPPGRSPSDPDVEITDLNGDSLPDLLVTRPGAYRSYLNHDGVSWKEGVDWDASQSPSVELAATGVQLADLDGDGAIDLVAKSGTSDFRYFPGSTETSFRAPVTIATVPNITFEDPDTKLADMDGDRRIDIVVTTAAGLAIGYNVNGVDWTTPQIVGTADPSQPLRFSDGGHTQLCDVNGDRVQDLCYLRSQSLVYWLGRGRGHFDVARTATGVPSWDPSSPWELHDLDGDGWVDLVHVGVDQVDYALATGLGHFDAPRAIHGVPEKLPTTVVRFADMNGSGTTDIVWIDVSGDPSSAWRYLDLFPNGRGGLLRRVDNGLGKVLSITYGAAGHDAADARDAGKPWTSRMNVAMSVVKRTEADDSLGDPVIASEYEYRDGTWSPVERTFAGFAGGTDKHLGDAYTPTLVEESTFDVGIADRTQRGLVLTSESRDANGVVFSRATSTYTSRQLEATAGGRFVHYTFKSAEETDHVEGTTTPRTTLVEWDQDSYGNVVRESHWGEVVTGDKLAGGDEAITVRTFANNTQDWLLGHVATEELQDAAGRRVRAKQFHYDGAPFTGLPLGQVARGDLARTDAWVGPGQDDWQLEASTAFDADGNPTETKDARGGGRKFAWDPKDRTSLLSETVKLESEQLTEHAVTDGAFGTLVSVTGYNEQTTTLAYDAFGRLTTIVRPGDSADKPTVSYAYTMAAPLSRVAASARVWVGRDDVEQAEDVYDGFGRKRATFAPDAAGRWAMAGIGFYDARGEVRRALRPRFVGDAEHASPPLHADGAGVDSWRDATGRQLRSRTQLGIESKSAFEPFVRKHWDGGQTSATSLYEHTPAVAELDGLGRVVANIHTLGGATFAARFLYDAAGALVSKTDADGNTARYAYDGRGRRVRVEDPDAGKHAFVFDATGAMLEHQKPDGSVTRFAYDLAGRTLTEDWDGDGKPEVTKAYDASERAPGSPLYRGLLAKVLDPSGSAENEYDTRARLTLVHRVIAGATYDVASAYDDQDREYWHKYPDGSSLRTWRNQRGILASYGHAVTFAYEADGTEVRRDVNTGVYQETGYDDDRRRNEVRVHAADGSVIEDLKWSYDDASNIVGIDDLRAGVAPDRDRTERYVYDNLYRLVGARGTWGDASWVFSPSGNLLKRITTVAAIGAADYGYGGAGPHAATSFKGRTLRYDALGRMLDDGDRKYTWDGGDHLVNVTAANGSSVASTFDAAGMRRVRVERSASGEEHTTAFIDASCEVKDGKLARFIVHEGRRIAKLSDKNGVPSAGALDGRDGDGEPPSRRLLWLGELARQLPLVLAILVALVVAYRRAIARAAKLALPAVAVALLSIACSNGAGDAAPPEILDGSIQTLSDADELLFGDAIGSLTEQTSGAGTPKSSFAPYPFGLTRYDSSPETRKYANSPRDASVGLDQMGARSYAPDLGVWTSVDPVTIERPERGIDADFAADHPYAYASLSPISRSDEDGRNPTVVGVGVVVTNPVLVIGFGVVMAWGTYNYATNSTFRDNVNNAVEKVADFAKETVAHAPDVGENAQGEATRELLDGASAGSAANQSKNTDAAAPTAEGKNQVTEAPSDPTPAKRPVVAKTPSGKRVGDFTRTQKNAAKAENAKANNGTMKCADCKKDVKNVNSEKGVPTPSNQAQVHHDPPIKDGGGKQSKATVLCPECHAERHRNE